MAVNAETLAAVRDFFERFRYAGLILPNGWFGRPHDNMHELTKGAASAGALVIELDGLHTLTFSGNTRAMASEQSCGSPASECSRGTGSKRASQ